MTFGIADMHRDKAQWQQRAWSDETSPLAPVVREPGTWAMKALSDLVWSTYFFGQALGFLLLPFFFVGLWDRRHAILRNPFECLLGGLVIFYVVGLAISYTGPRFMVHLIPYCFGWVSVGLLRLSKEVARAASNLHTSIASESIPIALALVILPQTLWPIGYDLRAFRYLANDLPKSESATIAAVDGRAAFYAQLQFAQLPAPVPGDLCGWIRAQRRIDYLLLSRRDEAVAPASSLNCVRRLKRYPHGRNGHFDLFEIKSPGHG